MIVQNKRLLIILSVAAILLLTPLIAMQFTSQVDWKTGDFVVAGVLLVGTGLACELVLRKVKTSPKRILICLGILAVLALVWLELAVGIFGTPFAGN